MDNDETRKKNKWFSNIFESLNSLGLEEVNDPERQWHCPACRGGVGAIDWYRGMQPILAHAKTIRTKRVKVHRKLAEILEEELRRRGAACVISEEMFGKWKGLRETVNDQEIVWPPMVIIQNTLLDQDENEQVCTISFGFICFRQIDMENMHLECHRNLVLLCF
jgi:hypothetical protein